MWLIAVISIWLLFVVVFVILCEVGVMDVDRHRELNNKMIITMPIAPRA